MTSFRWMPIVLLLAACGVDGEPIPPGSEEEEVEAQAVPVTQSTSTVISVGSNGVNGGVATTLNRGNVSITLGTGF